MSFATIAIAGGGVGLAGSIGKMIGRGKANKELEAIKAKVNAMQLNPEYAKQAALTQTQLQGRMAGASQAERNIYQQAANTQANINRAATDPIQAILGAGQIQGQTSETFNQLAQAEQADYANRLQRYMQAGMTKAQAEDALAQEKLQTTTQLSAAQQENRQNTWGDISNLGFAAANVGLSGMGGKFGKMSQMGTQGIQGTQNIQGTQSYRFMPSNPFGAGSSSGLNASNLNIQNINVPAWLGGTGQ